jgi:hypothetical protein
MKKLFGFLAASAVTLVSLFLSSSPSVADDAILEVCSKNLNKKAIDPIVQIVGRLGHLIEIAQGDGKVLYRAYSESRDQMGDGSNKISCSKDVRYYKNLIIIRMGAKNDQLQIYGINRNSSGKVTSLQQLIWNPRKSTIRTKVRIKAGVVRIRATNGRKGKLKNTFCWILGESWSYASKAPAKGGFAPCDKSYNDQRNIAVR